MNNWPLLVVLFMTKNRTKYALRVIKNMQKNLIYPNLKWYVADSGSHIDHFEKVKEAIGFELMAGFHTEALTPGQSWNKGIKAIYEHTDFYLRLEDDWVVGEKVDLRPWVKMLSIRDDIGMCRLGYLHVPADLEAITVAGIHYLRYQKTTQFCYGGHPSIIQKSFHDDYGYNHEEKNPGEIEMDMDQRVRLSDGVDIVRPASIKGFGVFHHVGEEGAY